VTLTQTEDILNSILPPREWTEDDQLWVQYVSSHPATRVDVINLQEELDKRLQQRQARETGICPIREELYAQCFDELIRQVTIICAERGLLLLRVRDEIRMATCAYQSLYESSVAFGMRKALQAEQRRNMHNQLMKTLQQEIRDLQQEVDSLQRRIVQIETREEERREAEERKHREEVESAKRHNSSLKEKLETILSAPKKAAA
jgi:dynein light intermediate chain